MYNHRLHADIIHNSNIVTNFTVIVERRDTTMQRTTRNESHHPAPNRILADESEFKCFIVLLGRLNRFAFLARARLRYEGPVFPEKSSQTLSPLMIFDVHVSWICCELSDLIGEAVGKYFQLSSYFLWTNLWCRSFGPNCSLRFTVTVIKEKLFRCANLCTRCAMHGILCFPLE